MKKVPKSTQKKDRKTETEKKRDIEKERNLK